MTDLFRQHHSFSPEDTESLGRSLAKALSSSEVICCFGDLGAGKTCFAKGFVSEAAGCPLQEIQSPTFTYLNSYGQQPKVHHFDLYRMGGAEEFYDMGFDDFFEQTGICVIEWAERLGKHLPKKYVRVQLAHIGPSERTVIVERIES